MFLKLEQIIFGKLAGVLLQYFCLLLVLILTSVGILISDAYLKCKSAIENPEQAKINFENNKISISLFGHELPDYTLEFSLKKSVMWVHFAYIIVSEIFFLACILRFEIKKALKVN